MKKLLIISSIIILILISTKNDQIVIPTNSIRVRVISNSNNINDQLEKVKVKSIVEETLYENIKETKTIEEARTEIKKSIPTLEKSIEKTINNDFSINFGTNYFPKKEMFGIEYNEGNYESIVINIGESKGKNWWCVLFPPICMIEAEENNKDNIEYKSKVLEILNEYK